MPGEMGRNGVEDVGRQIAVSIQERPRRIEPHHPEMITDIQRRGERKIGKNIQTAAKIGIVFDDAE